MADLGVTVIELLLKLIQVSHEDRIRYFDSLIKPLYDDAQVVASDYISLMGELVRRLETSEDLEAIATWLEVRREDYRSLRVKMRIALDQLPVKHGLVDDDPLIKGIWGLLRGGLSITDDGHVPYVGYGSGDHTVLDVLTRLRGQSAAANRARLLGFADRQRYVIEAAWKDATAGYYRYLSKVKA